MQCLRLFGYCASDCSDLCSHSVTLQSQLRLKLDPPGTRPLTCYAAFSLEQVVEDEPPDVSLLRREPLKVDVDLKLDVLADRVDPVRWLVLAEKILLATFEKPGII